MAVADDELQPPVHDETAVAPQRLRLALVAARRRFRRAMAAVQRLLAFTVFSNLTRRIIFLNLTALAVLVVGILYLNQWRVGLIDARVQGRRCSPTLRRGQRPGWPAGLPCQPAD